MKRSAFIVAGEPSGDKLAACLMRARPNYSFHGIGGPQMAAQGLISSYDYEALHVIGIAQAMVRYHQLRELLKKLVDDVCKLRPDVIFTIDAKAFSLRFAQAVKQRMEKEGWHAPLIHMVAPTVWAYGKKRARAFESAFDGLLCLFPMEESYFNPSKIKTSYIGHPAAYEPFLQRQNAQKEPHLLLLPGSRASEINSLLPSFLEAAHLFNTQNGGTVRLVTTDAMEALVLSHCQQHDVPVSISINNQDLPGELNKCDVMLAASGTVTLEAALAAIPGVVAYKLNPIVAWLMTKRVSLSDPILPNIISGTTIYPFYFQKHVSALNLSNALQESWQNHESHIKFMTEQAHQLRMSLRRDDVSTSFEQAISVGIDDLEMNL